MQGWLFDVYPSPRGIAVWVIDANGRSVSGYAPFVPSFYMHISPNDRPRVEAIARSLRCQVVNGWVEKTDLPTGQQLPVVEVRVPDILNFRRNVRIFESQFPFYVFFNSDLTPAQMFLFSRDFFPLAYGTYEFDNNGQLLLADINDRFDAIDYTLPPLTIMTLRPAFTDLAPKHQRSIQMEIGYDGRTYLLEVDSPAELIRRVNSHLFRCDPDLIVSSYGDHTLMPLLASLSQRTRIPLALNRDPTASFTTTRDVSYWSYGSIVHRAGSFELAGRLHVDTENSFIVDHSDLAGLFELARLTRIPVQQQARSSIGTGLSSMQLAWAYQNNVLIPSKKQEWERFKPVSQLLLADRGGVIYLPIQGYHEQVAEIDFASMYPTLMTIHNISPETINCACCDNHIVPELGYTICERRRGIIPETLGAVLRKRAAYKKRKREARTEKERKDYQSRQTALKWMLVTSFGYLGYKNARFGKIEAHESVNAFSRDSLLRAKTIAEERGFSVIHGIVDCLWLKKKGATAEEYTKLCDEISGKVGVPISLEGIYNWILFPASRMDPEIPTANRYVGTYTNGEIKVRGLEVRRGDAPLFVKNVQGDALRILAGASGIAELQAKIPTLLQSVEPHLERLRNGRVPALELVVRRTISKEAEEYENNSMQATVARAMAEAGVALKPGESAEYIIIDHTGRKFPEKATPLALYHVADGYDVEKYTELALEAIAVLTEDLGWPLEQLLEHFTPSAPARGKPAQKLTSTRQLSLTFE